MWTSSTRLNVIAALVATIATAHAEAPAAQPPAAKKPRPVDTVNLTKLVQPPTTRKIVGGRPAKPGKYPFQVALIASPTPVGREHFGQFCGGALIDRQWVLTAAHCVPDTTANEIDVYVGSSVLPSGRGGAGTQTGTRLHVSNIVSHQRYDATTHDNDIAMLKLAEQADVKLTPAVPATADVEQQFTNKPITVIGWGATAAGGNTVPRLMEVDIKPQDRAVCLANYQAVVPSSVITENMFCAGEPAGGKDSCQGDSGGFIGAPIGNGKFAQLGVVSWGIGCAEPKLFGVYTRAARYGDWIAQVMTSF